MSRTHRNLKHVDFFRNVRYKNAVTAASAWVDELEEFGFYPRPRDKALANIHGERVVTDWDDIRVSAHSEVSYAPFWCKGQTYQECSPEDRFARGPYTLWHWKKAWYISDVYLSAPRNLEDFSKIRLDTGETFGIFSVNEHTKEIRLWD